MPKLYVSPSSQENNTGPGGYVEEVVMNLIADALCAKLPLYPAIAFMRNRRGNTYAGHIAESDAFKPDIHLAIHSNAVNGKARGCIVFCFNPSDLNSPSTQLARILYKRVADLTPTADKGIQAGTMAEVATVKAKAVLIEIAFHDNPDDAAWIVNHVAEIAQALLLSLLDLWKIPYVIDPAEFTAMKGAIKQIKDIVSPF